MLGEVIHGYRVDRALSADKGGFGDVFFATHVDSGAEAVVKVLKPEMSAHRDIVARFFNEARAAASVHHPGIVAIHNVGYHGERAYLLMERLRGDDLETRLQHGPLPVERALVFVRQAAGAIGAAHDRGIVHRDLKPANLFVVADPDVVGGERVKVLDFGIAKLTLDAGAGKTQGVFGTPSYMSPEQCASTGAVDARADLYSLGCIFYELVCGRPPFGHGGLELIAAHLRDTPPPPRALAPWVPPAVEQVILRLLEKQPGHRYPSCAALIAALDAAAASSGLAGASQPYLPAGGMPSHPHLPSGGIPAGSAAPSTTFSSAAGAVASTLPAPRRGLGLWIGIAAIVVIAGAFAVLATRGGSPPVGAGHGSGNDSGSGPSDAAVALVTPDAATVAAVPDAAVAAVADAVISSPRRSDPLTSKPEVSEANVRKAADLWARGKRKMLEDRAAEAVPLFSESAALDPRPATFFGLGAAALQSGELDRARAALTTALARSPTSEFTAKVKKMLERVELEAEAQQRPRTPEATATTAKAPVQAELAARANEEGKEAMYRADYETGARKFAEAIARSPEAKYFVNLCTARLQSGRLREALTACLAIEHNNPTPDHKAKAAKLIDRIRAEARSQNIELTGP